MIGLGMAVLGENMMPDLDNTPQLWTRREPPPCALTMHPRCGVRKM